MTHKRPHTLRTCHRPPRNLPGNAALRCEPAAKEGPTRADRLRGNNPAGPSPI